MNRQLKIYVDNKLLDLFKDENIQFTSKLSDIELLSNVFTDFSETFTVPATPNNDAIFKHYYDTDITNGINANIRLDAFIEIDSMPFRFGKMVLEGAKIKGQRQSHYSLTFYGALTQLTGVFLEDTIDNLDYYTDPDTGITTKIWNSLSQFDYPLDDTNFYKTISDPTFHNGDVITPIISYTDRDWNYGTGDPFDISTAPIISNELRPALRLMKIIEGIEAKYDISFTRDFFGKAQFNNLFIWLNSSTDKPRTVEADFTLNTNAVSGPANPYFTTSDDILLNTFTVNETGYSYSNSRVFNLWIFFSSISGIFGENLGGENFTIEVVNQSTNQVDYIQTNICNSTTLTVDFLFNIPQSALATSTTYKIYLSSTKKFNYGNFDCVYDYRISPGVISRSGVVNNYGNASIYNEVDYLVPNMKVIDFVQGLMKMYKLIARPITTNSFYINTIDGYYDNGQILDITQYVNQKEVDILRPTIFKSIKFLFEKTNNVLGKKYREFFDPVYDEVGYGDLKYTVKDVDATNNLEIKLPFENLLFEKMVVSNPNPNSGQVTHLLFGQSVQVDAAGVVTKNNSKPILFYNDGLVSTGSYPVKYKYNSNTEQTLTKYFLCSNTDDALLSQVTASVNWGEEIDPWHEVKIPQSLYNNNWKGWLDTIYSPKQRKFNFSAILPSKYIEELTLNDKLIIGNNRYKINDYTINLINGETKLNLFTDVFSFEPPQPTLSTTSVIANGGAKFYGINVNGIWSVIKTNTGNGTFWLDWNKDINGIDITSGEKTDELTFRLKGYTTSSTRTMDLTITVDGITHIITITQNGI